MNRNQNELKKLFEKRNEKLERMEALSNLAVEEVRAFSPEEQEEFDTLEGEAKALTETIERVRKETEKDVSKASEEQRAELEKEEAEKQAFVGYLRNTYLSLPEEVRAEANFTVDANTAVIPSSIAHKIIEEAKNRCPILALASHYNVKGDLYFPVYTEGIGMDYAEEFTDPVHTAGSFSSIKLTGFLARATTLVSRSLINNAYFDLFTFIVGKVGQAVADFWEKELLNGTADKIEGLSSITATQTTLTADSLIDLQDSINSGFQKNCRFIMSPATKNKIRKFKDGQGNYLLERNYATGTGNWTLLGKPIEITDQLADDTIFYGDFSALAVKMVEEPTIEVIREKYYEQHAVGVCVWLEADAKVIDPQRIVKLAVTP